MAAVRKMAQIYDPRTYKRVVFKKKTFTMMEKIAILMKDFHIRPIKSIEYRFDPYMQNVLALRTVLFHLNTKAVLATSSAKSKVDVKADRSPPEIDIVFNDGHRVIFKTERLNALDVLERLDKMCKAKDTFVPEADAALTKVSGKPKARKK